MSSEQEKIETCPLPPYTYVPGQTPHPISSREGHIGEAELDVGAVDHWWQGTAFRWGVRLFNEGYYWEAHEAWEVIWKALPRSSPQADWVQGLIKLAACGVKCLEGNAAGAARHARRAGELLDHGEQAICRTPLVAQSLNLRKVVSMLANSPPVMSPPSPGIPRPVLGITLAPPPAPG